MRKLLGLCYLHTSWRSYINSWANMSPSNSKISICCLCSNTAIPFLPSFRFWERKGKVLPFKRKNYTLRWGRFEYSSSIRATSCPCQKRSSQFAQAVSLFIVLPLHFSLPLMCVRASTSVISVARVAFVGTYLWMPFPWLEHYKLPLPSKFLDVTPVTCSL